MGIQAGWIRGASIGALLVSASMPTLVLAQSTENEEASSTRGGVQDIIVTATRQETDLQTTPIAVSAVTSDTLLENHVDDVRGLGSLAPSLVISGQAGQEFPIAIRGISSGSQAIGGDSPVAVYLDGIYLGRQLAILFDLPDIERIEVSRGPQGTLFGRNNTAGSINIITKKPSFEDGGRLLIRYGNRNALAVKGYYSGALSDKVALKIGATAHRDDGFETWVQTGDKVNGENTYTINGGLLIQPSENLEFDLRADYTDGTVGLAVRHLAPTPGPVSYGIDACPIDCDQLNAEDSFAFDQNLKNYGVGLTTSLDVGEDLLLRSITGYRYSNVNYVFNNDSIELVLQRFQYDATAEQFSQELNISKNHGRFTWIAGLYYFQEDNTLPYAVEGYGAPGGPSRVTAAEATVDTRSYAVYANGNFDVTDQFSVTLGGRFSHEKKSFTRYGTQLFGSYFPGIVEAGDRSTYALEYDLTDSWDSFSPRISLNYEITPDVFAYATFSKGDKSGGYSFSAAGIDDASFNPEKVLSYEVGLKNTLFDRQMRLNLSAFYYDYTGLQIAVAPTPGVRQIVNAGKAEVYGLEAEFDIRPQGLEGFSISGNAAYLDATYKEFLLPEGNPALCIGGVYDPVAMTCDLKGNRLPRSPKFSATVIVRYAAETEIGTITPQVKITHQGSMFYSEQNDPYGAKDATTEIDAQLSFTPQGSAFTITGWVRNLTDERYIYNARPSAIRAAPGFPDTPFPVNGVGSYGRPNPPRSYGVEVSAKF